MTETNDGLMAKTASRRRAISNLGWFAGTVANGAFWGLAIGVTMASAAAYVCGQLAITKRTFTRAAGAGALAGGLFGVARGVYSYNEVPDVEAPPSEMVDGSADLGGGIEGHVTKLSNNRTTGTIGRLA